MTGRTPTGNSLVRIKAADNRQAKELDLLFSLIAACQCCAERTSTAVVQAELILAAAQKDKGGLQCQSLAPAQALHTTWAAPKCSTGLLTQPYAAQPRFVGTGVADTAGSSP